MVEKKKKSYNRNNQFARKHSDKEIDAFIKELLDYALNAKSIHFAPFLYNKGLSKSWLLETEQHYPKLKQAHLEAKQLISSKIVNLSFYDKQVNAYAGLQYLGVYDKEYKDLKVNADSGNTFILTKKDSSKPSKS